jgi:branched-chain amino acid transport system permease protein
MLQYIFAGLALGSIYAIAAAGLVITYSSAGILNFAYGSMAFSIAYLNYELHNNHGWGILPAAVVSILIAAPLLGIALWALVFRHLRNAAPVVKIVATIGLSVALPPICLLIFGVTPITSAPGLAPIPVRVFHPFSSTVDLNQIIIYACLILIVVLGTAVLRLTDMGLRVRAMVESEALTSLSGTNPQRISIGVWALSTALAGLAGVLVAPTQGLTIPGMTALMVAAFAAVVAGRLRSLPVAVGAAMAMGLITDVLQKYLPVNGQLSQDLLPSIPFLFILLFLLYYVVRTGRVNEVATGAGVLDQAIALKGNDRSTYSLALSAMSARRGFSVWRLLPLVPLVVVAFLPLIFSSFWLNLAAEGFALAIALLSYTLVTGEGGMIWLCQITFAGGGAVFGAQLATNAGWPPLLAAFAAACLMVPVGVLIGVLTIRLGDLYVALVTLSFGLLVDTLVFARQRYAQSGVGVNFNRPGFAQTDRAFSYLALVVFGILAILILNLRRSTTGLALNAVRWSEPGSRTLGLSVVRVKVVTAGIAAFVAALGGAFLAMWNLSADPTSFATFTGLIWLAVLVTIGLRSITAAVLAGLAYTMLGNVFTTYLPTSQKWAIVPTLLFGLGAIGVVRNPDGVLVQWARVAQRLVLRWLGRSGSTLDGPDVDALLATDIDQHSDAVTRA